MTRDKRTASLILQSIMQDDTADGHGRDTLVKADVAYTMTTDDTPPIIITIMVKWNSQKHVDEAKPTNKPCNRRA